MLETYNFLCEVAEELHDYFPKSYKIAVVKTENPRPQEPLIEPYIYIITDGSTKTSYADFSIYHVNGMLIGSDYFMLENNFKVSLSDKNVNPAKEIARNYCDIVSGLLNGWDCLSLDEQSALYSVFETSIPYIMDRVNDSPTPQS